MRIKANMDLIGCDNILLQQQFDCCSVTRPCSILQIVGCQRTGPGNEATECIHVWPGHSQILSRSRGEKSGEGLGAKLRHGPEMVDLVST